MEFIKLNNPEDRFTLQEIEINNIKLFFRQTNVLSGEHWVVNKTVLDIFEDSFIGIDYDIIELTISDFPIEEE